MEELTMGGEVTHKTQWPRFARRANLGRDDISVPEVPMNADPIPRFTIADTITFADFFKPMSVLTALAPYSRPSVKIIRDASKIGPERWPVVFRDLDKLIRDFSSEVNAVGLSVRHRGWAPRLKHAVIMLTRRYDKRRRELMEVLIAQRWQRHGIPIEDVSVISGGSRASSNCSAEALAVLNYLGMCVAILMLECSRHHAHRKLYLWLRSWTDVLQSSMDFTDPRRDDTGRQCLYHVFPLTSRSSYVGVTTRTMEDRFIKEHLANTINLSTKKEIPA